MTGVRQSVLFGETTIRREARDRPEAAALAEVLAALRHHPAVAWAERQNSGAIRVGQRFVRFGWRGCADVLGQLKDGRLLACEVKARRGRLRPEQAVFLDRVRRFGGVSIVARGAKDVFAALGPIDLDIAGAKQ